MNNSTVWYTITDSEYPYCANPMVFACDLPEKVARQIQKAFAVELAFVTGLDGDKIAVWVD